MGVLEFIDRLDPSIVAIRSVGYGLAIAAIIAFFVSATARRVVKAILTAGALSPETAKSAAELGLTGPLVRRALKEGSSLRKTVKRSVWNEGFFIPEEDAGRAEVRYVKKNNPIAWIAGIALIVAATEAVVLILPLVLGSFV